MAIVAKQRPQLRTLKLHAWENWTHGRRMAGTDVRLQEPLQVAGFSMTLASVLFGRESLREQHTLRDRV